MGYLATFVTSGVPCGPPAGRDRLPAGPSPRCRPGSLLRLPAAPRRRPAGVRGKGPSLAPRVNHVRLCGQATLAAKVGFFLERRQAVLGVPRTVLERLRRMRPKQPHYLDRKVGGRMAPGWNLMVPAPALTGEWETIRYGVRLRRSATRDTVSARARQQVRILRGARCGGEGHRNRGGGMPCQS